MTERDQISPHKPKEELRHQMVQKVMKVQWQKIKYWNEYRSEMNKIVEYVKVEGSCTKRERDITKRRGKGGYETKSGAKGTRPRGCRDGDEAEKTNTTCRDNTSMRRWCRIGGGKGGRVNGGGGGND